MLNACEGTCYFHFIGMLILLSAFVQSNIMQLHTEPSHSVLDIDQSSYMPEFPREENVAKESVDLDSLITKQSNSTPKNISHVDASKPNLEKIKTLMAKYGPLVYFHPDEKYFPSSVAWFFQNGALLYKKGNEKNPVKIDPTGSNLPQGGATDGAFWIDLPIDKKAREQSIKGDIKSAKGYVHIKPMLGGTVTDLAIWVFYPYNGPATGKLLPFNIKMRQIGSHVGDWEHITLRINNLDGKLQKMYFSQHSKGEWVDANKLEYANNKKPVAYSSRNGHAMYPHGSLIMQGNNYMGMENAMAKSNFFIDLGVNFEMVSGEYLGIVEPPWLNYIRQWGPKIKYTAHNVLNKVKHILFFKSLKTKFEQSVNRLPQEVLGQDGPTGPKCKPSWNGDEVV